LKREKTYTESHSALLGERRQPRRAAPLLLYGSALMPGPRELQQFTPPENLCRWVHSGTFTGTAANAVKRLLFPAYS